MTAQVLVAYATKYGSTRGVAEAIASRLAEPGMDVDLQPVGEVRSLDRYDAVVLGDVLEHLATPEVVLQKLIALQTSSSIFLISVPNITNLWVRLNLLIGRFDYTDRGILDRTHLRFFTRKTLVQMINHSGLKIVSIQVTPIPLELVSRFFVSPLGKIFHAVFAKLTSLFPTLLGYQFIVEAKKP